MRKRVAVLGATGSIGKSTLDVLRSAPDLFQPVLFSARTSCEELLRLKEEFPGAITALSGEGQAGSPLDTAPAGIDFTGSAGLLDAIAAAGADICLNGIAGSAGLVPSCAALNAGCDLALANKETVVMAGPLVFALAAEKQRRIIPVDSEHSAIFKLIEAHGADNISEVILTASGGPFREYTQEMLSGVTPGQALVHPTWSMGPKITVDSATLANKGLEVIEAARLFGLPLETIKVVVHPQSVVHSMVRLKNGAVYAQMSKPDMRLPIHDALAWPDTPPSPFGVLDFDGLTLTFETCAAGRFPMLDLAYEALAGGALLPAVYNAANEVAVDLFLKNQINFLEIPRIVGYVIRDSRAKVDEMLTIENVLAQDACARELVATKVNGSLKC
ncbi:MAG: 1-deoxy-D-xylulose-5-phosphate reductoisomerase [Treponema sp.]|nr:1-deoxy-D-xylulose-5-phosphate reductoisomerase [Treponema sp.]